jgi:hypothetical protein
MVASLAIVILRASSGEPEELLRDGFNDGDYLDGEPVVWSIDWSHSGNPNGDPSRLDFDPPTVECEVENCYLVGHTAESSGLKNTALIYASNPTDVGRWQFVSRLPGPDPQAGNGIMLATDTTPWNGDYYGVSHTPESGGRSTVRLVRKLGSSFTDLIVVEGPPQGEWATVAVSRDEAGTWTLYLNGGAVGVANDTAITTFPFFSVGRYAAYDNVVISSCAGFFGPQDQPLEFVRLPGKPEAQVIEWESCGGEGELLVQATGTVIAEVEVNGTAVISRNDRLRDQEFRIPVDLKQGENKIEITQFGAPSTALRIALYE